MTAVSLAMHGMIHTGACAAVPRALADVALRFGSLFIEEPHDTEYCLHDEAGRPLGVIRGTAGRPRVGFAAPAVLLQRG